MWVEGGIWASMYEQREGEAETKEVIEACSAGPSGAQNRQGQAHVTAGVTMRH